MKRRPVRRRQRVQLRGKTRHERRSGFLRRILKLMVLVGVVALFPPVFKEVRQMVGTWRAHHTPNVSWVLPGNVSETKWQSRFPLDSTLVWLPWKTKSFSNRMLAEERGLRSVVVEKNFLANRLQVKGISRKPLVQVGPEWMDEEGVLFPADPTLNIHLPQMKWKPDLFSLSIGKWLRKLALHARLWDNVLVIDSDLRGNAVLFLADGTKVIWGLPDPELVDARAPHLVAILEDTQSRWGGAALVDLTLMQDGRAIVRPLLKAVSGKSQKTSPHLQVPGTTR